ncbi:unnamed protein product [Effrenium voratum]|uniref:Uncharacterized protein n=1 Tax=Effrenium voratum TaxID=2562239 RepID=A0AA36I9L0_9DINO|nr:unnamed protein product [Effrenium voratum]
MAYAKAPGYGSAISVRARALAAARAARWPSKRRLRRSRPSRPRKSRIRGPGGYPRVGGKVHQLLQQEVEVNIPELQAELSTKAAEAVRRGHRCLPAFDGEVLCVSLAACQSRRRHTELELSRWGFPAPHFVDAFGPSAAEVLQAFNSPRVAKFPPCFRCGMVDDCCCANNDMLLEQIANWLSFRKAWAIIADSEREWHLLVEDDLKFTHKAAECWNELITPELLMENAGVPCLVRCGWQLGLEYLDEDPCELLEDAVRMSNHCSLMNRAMARELLQGSEEHICATSDVYTHEVVAPAHRHFTMFPPISYDLSFALKVPSLIRPKGTAEDDLQHAMAVERARRVEVHNIRVWLQTLVWVRGPVVQLDLPLLQSWTAVGEGEEEPLVG